MSHSEPRLARAGVEPLLSYRLSQVRAKGQGFRILFFRSQQEYSWQSESTSHSPHRLLQPCARRCGANLFGSEMRSYMCVASRTERFVPTPAETNITIKKKSIAISRSWPPMASTPSGFTIRRPFHCLTQLTGTGCV